MEKLYRDINFFPYRTALDVPKKSRPIDQPTKICNMLLQVFTRSMSILPLPYKSRIEMSMMDLFAGCLVSYRNHKR